MEAVVGTFAVVLVGLMVGVEFSVAAFVNPIFDRLPHDGGLAARSDGARLLGRVMPFWYIGSVAIAVVWTVLTWGEPRTWTVIAAAALLVVSVLMSIALLVPINSQVATWSANAIPADWKQQAHRWDRLHHVRVAVIIAAFALLAWAASR
jgi:uncharacterized membrane protein